MPEIGAGSEIKLVGAGTRTIVTRIIGEGGQGTVYELAADDGGRLALKWYHPHTATAAQRACVAELVERGSPSGRFLWPLDIAASAVVADGFGYVMPLRPAEYIGLAALMEGKVEVSLATVFTIGYQLADSYLRLHVEGLCYRDISFGNVFFDPGTGEVLICDNDNVGIDGESTSAVIGTKRFIAPEIVRKEARPSIDSDLYSLAVLLFYVLMIGHPLLGRRELAFPMWDQEAELQLFGVDPLFVFDPDNDSNRPVPGVHDAMLDNWPIYPLSLRRLFERSFTRGLRDAHDGRIRESQWRREMVRCRDQLAECHGCAAMNIFDPGDVGKACWQCGRPTVAPLCLRLPNGLVVLNDSTTISAHHLDAPYDFGHVLGRIARHPVLPDVWGLRNESPRPWNVRLTSGSDVLVDPGRSISMMPGVEIDFGSGRGSVVIGGHH